jgi:hypothetical protein
MSAQLIPFPGPAHGPAHGPAAGPALVPLRVPVGPVLRFYDCAQVARLVGLIGPRVTPRARIDHLRRLVATAGLPAPHTHRWRKGKHCTGAAAVCARSLWDAAKVDAWLDRPQPGAPGSQAAYPEPGRGTDLREQMRARAIAIAGAGR